ncbi:MAG: YegP family protein [Rhodoferax sp.]|uniref:YegP family protein n=1 Tax=Rhodoferax sp. TaxID=50421 RepID=UPI003C765944
MVLPHHFSEIAGTVFTGENKVGHFLILRSSHTGKVVRPGGRSIESLPGQSSESYTTEAARDNGIASVKSKARQAPTKDLTED